MDLPNIPTGVHSLLVHKMATCSSAVSVLVRKLGVRPTAGKRFCLVQHNRKTKGDSLPLAHATLPCSISSARAHTLTYACMHTHTTHTHTHTTHTHNTNTHTTHTRTYTQHTHTHNTRAHTQTASIFILYSYKGTKGDSTVAPSTSNMGGRTLPVCLERAPSL